MTTSDLTIVALEALCNVAHGALPFPIPMLDSIGQDAKALVLSWAPEATYASTRAIIGDRIEALLSVHNDAVAWALDHRPRAR